MIIEDGILKSISEEDIIDFHFTIPDNVKAIGYNAFKNCSSLKTITIPNSVEVIEDGAFFSCKNLESVDIPSSVKIIGNEVFSFCENLHSVKLFDGLKKIGSKAFLSCKSLTKIKIPDTVTSVGEYAFFDCSSLKNAKLSKNQDSIANKTFSNCSKLTHVTIPNGISKIDSYAFTNCFKLRSISIPESVTEIKMGAFQSCEKLTFVHLPNNLKTIEEKTFYFCVNLRFINLPQNLAKIDKQAFSNCSKLSSVSLPENVVVIDKYAFSQCHNLKSIKLNENLKTIGASAFLESGLRSITIPEKVSKIGSGAFENCSKLKFATINGKIARLQNNTFSNCFSLKNAILPDSLKSIEQSAFENCEKLESVNLPDSVTEINSKAFYDCSEITDISLPQSLVSIGDSAFEDCFMLTNVNCPSSLKTIGNQAFYRCISVESVKLNEGLVSVGNSAFLNCSKVSEFIFPSTVSSIGRNAVQISNNVNKLYIPKSVQKVGTISGHKLKYLTIHNDGVEFSNTENPSSKSTDNINIGVNVLCSNFDYFDLILKEQKNPSIAYFYDNFFIKLPKDKQDDFLKNHNFTFFKQIASKFEVKSEGAMSALYNLGVFESAKIVDGKRVDSAQKISGFLLEKFEKKELDFSTLTSIGNTMSNNGVNSEFNEFFISHFSELIAEEKSHRGFIANCYNRFYEVQATNTSNRGNQRQLKPTVQKFKEFFIEHKYEGIDTLEKKKIAKTISPYFGSQSVFDEAVAIFDEKDIKGVPDHILSIPLKDEPLKDPFKNIDEYDFIIQNTEAEIVSNLTETAQKEFTFEWLSKNDPENLIIGKLCNCCAHILGMGYGIMKASIVHPNVQNLVIRDKNNKIVAKSTLFINPQKGYGVFNNVEISELYEYSPKRTEKIYHEYILGVQKFVEQYNKEHPDAPLRKINIGMGFNDLESIIRKNHLKSPEILYAINYSRFSNDETSHRGDSSYEQYILWDEDTFNK